MCAFPCASFLIHSCTFVPSLPARPQGCKFKGLRCKSTLVRASPSADGSLVVSGSEDGWVFAWASGLNGQEVSCVLHMSRGMHQPTVTN